jgi:hypothetical protein
MRGVVGWRLAGSASALAALLLLAPAGAGAVDVDGDGVLDGADDCSELANPNQRDTDEDGFGNACDPDIDQNGVVGWPDRSAIEQAFGARVGDPGYDADLDLDGDGVIGSYERTEVQRRLGLPPGPSGLACAGEIPCRAGLVKIDLAEEVLSRSVRLTWRPASPQGVFDVERRAPAVGEWQHLARLLGRQQEFVDRGIAGRGLAAGTYEYRVRGTAEWSSPRSVAIGAECAGQPETSALLPVVEIVDHEPDGDYDGEDVVAALAECSRQRGCVLRGLPVTYEDVNVQLAADTGYDFSRGLVIEGYGSATVFRSRVFSARDHDPRYCRPGAEPPCYLPIPVFYIRDPGRTVLDGVRFRNFGIDGRKREQPDPGFPSEGWRHWGIVVISSTPESTDGGCVHDVKASGLMSGGLGVNTARDWIFENNTVQDIGCQDDLTPCDALERTPEYLSIPGMQSQAHAIYASYATEGTVVRNNYVARATKFGIAANFGSARFRIHDNVVEEGGGAGIQCNSCGGGVIERNVVRSMHYPTGRNVTWPDGYRGELAQGIQCTATGHDVSIVDNLVLWGEGSGVRMQCGGPNLLVERNTIVGNCRKYGQSLVVADGEGAVVRGNVVRDHPGGCEWSVLVLRARNARIEGGSVEGGPGTRAGVFVVGAPGEPATGLLLRNLRVTARGSSGAGVHLASTSTGTTLFDSVCTNGFASALVDQSTGGVIHASDPAGACGP